MSEINLLAFGCVVTFLGVAGAYVHIRESFMSGTDRPRDSEVRGVQAVHQEARDTV